MAGSAPSLPANVWPLLKVSVGEAVVPQEGVAFATICMVNVDVAVSSSRSVAVMVTVNSPTVPACVRKSTLNCWLLCVMPSGKASGVRSVVTVYFTGALPAVVEPSVGKASVALVLPAT